MNGRSIIVTGGFGVLGRAVSAAFARHGDRVARIDVASSAPDAVPDGFDLPGVDLTNIAAVRTAVAQIVDQFGGVDVLVNIAGGFVWETLEAGEIETWQNMFAMNLQSTIVATKAALTAVKASSEGRIINIGAGAAIRADSGMGAYAASKSGVHRLTEALASECAGSTVTVNAILPSIIDTPTNRLDMPDADFSTWVQPEAIADIALFLASPSARAISGALVPASRCASA